MKTYNTVIILTPDKAEYEPTAKKIHDMYQTITGDKYKVRYECMGIKKLAYKIKDTYEEGYYISLYWRGTDEDLETTEKSLRMSSNILKFMTADVDADDDNFELEPQQEKEIVDVLELIYNI